MRKSKKMKLREVGELLKITPQCVKIQEIKGVTKIGTAKRYAAALGCDWKELLD